MNNRTHAGRMPDLQERNRMRRILIVEDEFVNRELLKAYLEDKYELGFGIKPDNEDKLYETVKYLLNMDDRKEAFQARRRKMLSESINFADFLTNYIESYPIKKQ